MKKIQQTNRCYGRIFNHNLDLLKYGSSWAGEFSKYTHVIGYDVLPEPDRTIFAKQYQFVANNVLKSVRRTDPNHIIFMGGISAFLPDWEKEGVLPFKDDKLVFSMPFFEPEDFTLQKSPWNTSNENEKYPDYKEV